MTRRLLMLDQVTHVELRRVEKDTRNNFVVYNQNVMFGSVLLKLNVQLELDSTMSQSRIEF